MGTRAACSHSKDYKMVIVNDQPKGASVRVRELNGCMHLAEFGHVPREPVASLGGIQRYGDLAVPFALAISCGKGHATRDFTWEPPAQSSAKGGSLNRE